MHDLEFFNASTIELWVGLNYNCPTFRSLRAEVWKEHISQGWKQSNHFAEHFKACPVCAPKVIAWRIEHGPAENP